MPSGLQPGVVSKVEEQALSVQEWVGEHFVGIEHGGRGDPKLLQFGGGRVLGSSACPGSDVRAEVCPRRRTYEFGQRGFGFGPAGHTATHSSLPSAG